MRRVPELDAIRGLACLLIVLHHNEFAFPGAQFSVDLFFVLSGYLITLIILKNRGNSRFLLKFYMRRGLRIWPIYYLTILALLAICPLVQRPCHLAALPYYLTYTQYAYIYFGAPSPAFSPPLYHTWTLAIEEQFYLIWPAAVLLVGGRRVVPTALAGLGMTWFARYHGLSIWTLLGRLDGLMLGSILAAIFSDERLVAARPRRLAAAFALCVALGPALLAAAVLAERARPGAGGDFQVMFSYTFINLAFFGIVGLTVLGAGKPLLAPLRHPWLAYIGLISYGLYLYHVPIRHAADGIAERLGLGENDPLLRAISIAVSLGVASASWTFIERPILALKDRFRYREPAAAPVDPADRPSSVGALDPEPIGGTVPLPR